MNSCTNWEFLAIPLIIFAFLAGLALLTKAEKSK